MNCNEIKERIGSIRNTIEQKRELILSVLVKSETYKTANTEIEKSISCLVNIDKQLSYLINSKLSSLSVFLPLNQPLYSIILFVIIPGCRFDQVYFRPPKLLMSVYKDIYNILGLSKYNIYCEQVSRGVFIKQRVINSDSVIYTGKYENAIEVKEQLPKETVFIFQGSASNPIIITKEAIISDDIIEKIVSAQLYNSGQDCMAPSAIFVHSSRWEYFLEQLKKKVSSLVVGDYDDVNADISTLIEPSTLENAELLLKRYSDSILYGGEFDYILQRMYPCILEYEKIDDIPAESTFAPVFSLYKYCFEEEIIEYLSRPDCQENRAYVSIFGEVSSWSRDEIIIRNNVLDVVDDGFSEFGGFGIHSGFISYDGLVTAKPILISRELSMFTRTKGHIIPEGNTETPLFEAFIASSLVNMSGNEVLEIGCGLLPHARLLAANCAAYYAIDTNLEKIKKIGDIHNKKIHVACMDASNIEYQDIKFSAVYLFHCLHEADLSKQSRILTEAIRLLEDEGVILLIDTVPDRITDYQKCFDVVHEDILGYKHVFGVQHEDWVIRKHLENGILSEIYNKRFCLNYHFDSINELYKSIIDSFEYEVIWDEDKQKLLLCMLQNEFGVRETYDIEEEIIVRLLKKTH